MEETEKALLAGVELAKAAADEGYTLLGTGEMGIANTTPSAALFAALLPCPVEEVAGRGTGIDDRGLQHKIDISRKRGRIKAGDIDGQWRIIRSGNGAKGSPLYIGPQALGQKPFFHFVFSLGCGI